MELPNPSPNHPEDSSQPNRIYAVIYLGEGRYALDQFRSGAVPHRLSHAVSFMTIDATLRRIQRPGDVVIMSEALRAMRLLELPCSRLSWLQAQLGECDLFDIHGEVAVVPMEEHASASICGSVQIDHCGQGAPAPNRIKRLFDTEEQGGTADAPPDSN
jgi:hypothetical protein